MNPRVKMRGYGGAALVVLTGTVAWLMIQNPALQESADTSSITANQALTKVAEVEGKVKANEKALAEANARLIALGKTPVAVPAAAASSPPVQVDEFTDAEAAAVRVIVADQISRQKVTITQAEISQIARIAAALVPKPKDGSTPTAAQLQPIVTATLAAYCVDDKCVGAKGDEGDTGPKGDLGERGEQGPKVTDEELLTAARTALVAYCGQESKPCDGSVGPAGPAGERGVSVDDMDCVGQGDESSWRIHFSDGTTTTASGPCRVALPETPSEPQTGN